MGLLKIQWVSLRTQMGPLRTHLGPLWALMGSLVFLSSFVSSKHQLDIVMSSWPPMGPKDPFTLIFFLLHFLF
jgi:hypothetical protein